MNEKITLYLYECSEPNCKHSFYSSVEQSVCPNCDEHSLNCVNTKVAVISEDSEPSIIDGIKSFFSYKGLVLPSSISIKMGTEFNGDEPWQYLSSVNIEGDFENKDNLETDLKTFVNDNFSISEMEENKLISFA
jgi:hypothetical protein